MQIWALIKDGFRESRDRRIFWVMLLLSGLVATAMACVRFDADGVDLFFGMWKFGVAELGLAAPLDHGLIAAVVVDGIMDTVLGSLGIVLALVATAGFIPHMLQEGVIDVVVSKPLPRWKLFMGRYLGGLTFILVHATIFVGLTFLMAGLRWGVWLPGYLLAIPLITVLFSYLYCISALTGLVTRSAIAAVLVSLGAWMAFGGIQTADDLLNTGVLASERNAALASLHMMRQVIPKTQDVLHLAKRWSRAANASDLIAAPGDPEARDMVDQARRAEEARKNIPAFQTLGSSLLFELVILGVAIWRFSRMDF